MAATLEKMAAILNYIFDVDDVIEKMVPSFFEINTPKLTKLANKINFGTKIERENITNCTKMKF